MAIPLDRSWDEQRRMMVEPYEHQMKQYEYELRKYKSTVEAAQQERKFAEEKLHAQKESRMQAQLSQWQDAVEELAKVEAMLASLIANEIGSTQSMSISAATRQMQMNWSGRLDTIIGELGRYRETLMRRVADGLLPRLTQDAETEGSQTASGIASRLQAAIGKPLV